MNFAIYLILALGLFYPSFESAETDAEYSRIYKNVFGSNKLEILGSFGKKVSFDISRESVWTFGIDQLTLFSAALNYSQAPSLTPDETLDQLKRLNDIGPKTPEDKERVTELVEANESSPNKCDAAKFKSINSLYSDKTREAGTIKPYLDRCVEQQFAICKDNFAAQLKNSVDQLDKQLIIDLQNLRRCYSMDSVNRQENFKLGALELSKVVDMLKVFNPLTDGETLRTSLISSADDVKKTVSKKISTITVLCNEALAFTNTPLESYVALAGRPNIVNRFDDYTNKWVANLFLCKNLLKSFEVHENGRKKMITKIALKRNTEIEEFLNGHGEYV